jgi:hypothetical protein
MKTEERRFFMNETIKKMQSGDISTLKNGFNAKGAIYRVNAIAWATKNNIIDEELIAYIKKSINDNTLISGYTVGQFALASLDILNIQKYQGDDISVKNLIKSNFDFLNEL